MKEVEYIAHCIAEQMPVEPLSFASTYTAIVKFIYIFQKQIYICIFF